MATAGVAGEPTHTGTKMVETATGALQSFAPINKIHQHLCAFHFYAHDMTRQVEAHHFCSHQHLCAFHFYAHDMTRQVEAHHFCSHQNEEMRQCLIYDGPDSTARLIGVEYIISDNLFLTLPDEEKPLWHSHEYEVKGGFLFMPSVPSLVQRQDLEKISRTYGKTIHFWQVDRGDELPLGPPQLMMALTEEGQLNDELRRDVERKFGMNFEEERGKRRYMSGPEHGIHPMANGAGKGLRFEIREVELPSAEMVPRIFV